MIAARAALTLSLLCAAATAARADHGIEPHLAPLQDEKPMPAAKPVPPEAISPTTTARKAFGPRRWYGWQLVAADAPVWLAAWKLQPATMGLLASGPIVHLLHGEDERAQASLAVRLVGAMFGAGVTGLALFDRACPPDRTTCPPGMSTIMKGASVGLVLAEIVDVAVIGWTSTADGDDALPPIASSSARRREERPGISSGGLILGDGRVGVALSGSF
jgi:hypothetical protein